MLVAFSGGPDSTACLVVLRALREEFGFDLTAAHFDHQIRPESRHDLERARHIASTLGIEFVSGEGDVASVARQQRANLEETARKMRYQFLAFVAGKEGADCLATGHTYDDQAETVLMRIVRGTGVRGVRGMLPSSGIPGAEAQRLVRPLLVLRREETVAICAEAGIEPAADSSNTDMRILRNRLRHEALATLRGINPSVDDALVGLAASAREVFASVERRSFEVQPRERTPIGAIFALPAFAGLPKEARTLVIEREAAFWHLQPAVNRTRVDNLERMLAKGTGEVRFGDAIVEASSGKVRIGPELELPEPFEARLLNVPGVTVAGSWRVEIATAPLTPAPGALTASVDGASLSGALRVRPLHPGDTIRYRGLQRSVADLLINEKVPSWERSGAVALADSAAVVAIFTASGVIGDQASGDDILYVRVQQAPTR